MHDPDVRLTEEEQRRLQMLEAAISEDDPRLARRMRRAHRIPLVGVVTATMPPRGWTGALAIVLGAVLMLSTFTSLFAVAVIGALVMGAGIYLLLTAPELHRAVRRLTRRGGLA